MNSIYLLFLLLFGTLSADQAVWKELLRNSNQTNDTATLTDGTVLEGRVTALPSLIYPFGEIRIEIDDTRAILLYPRNALNQRAEFLTTEGGEFIANIYTHEIEFREVSGAVIPFNRLKTVVLAPRSKKASCIDQFPFTLITPTGLKVPVALTDNDILLRSEDQLMHVPTHQLVALKHKGNRKVMSSLKDSVIQVATILENNVPVFLPFDKRLALIDLYDIQAIEKSSSVFIERNCKVTPVSMIYVPFDVAYVSVDMMSDQEIAMVDYNLAPTKECPSCLFPQRGFYIDPKEVTNEEYLSFVNATNHKAPSHWINGKIPSGKEKASVVNVSFVDAEEYAKWAGKRLPTEVEWQRASIVSKADKRLSNFSTDVKTSLQDIDDEINVAEWTASTYGPYDGPFKVVRRGFIIESNLEIPPSRRAAMHVADQNLYTSFRCVRDN